MAPFGLKLWENAFQTIPDISSFDVETNFSTVIFDKIFVGKFLVLAKGHICPGLLARGHICLG